MAQESLNNAVEHIKKQIDEFEKKKVINSTYLHMILEKGG